MTLQKGKKIAKYGNPEFGTLVSRLRDENGWTQADLVARAGELQPDDPLTLKQVRDIEQGKTGIAGLLDHIELLAQAFELKDEHKAGFYTVAGLAYPYRDKRRSNRIIDALMRGDVPSYTFVKEKEANGVRWVVNWRQDMGEKEHVGIRAFELIIEKKQTIEKVLQSTGETRDSLRQAVKSPLRSKTLQVTGVDRDQGREQQLEGIFPNVKAFVAGIPRFEGELIRTELIAHLAASEVFNKLTNPRAVGVGSGYTMARFAALTQPSIEKFRSTRWIPFEQVTHKAIYHLSANQIGCILARHQPGSEAIYFPYMHRPPSAYSRDRYKELIEATSQMSEGFISINGIGKDPSNFNHLYTADGNTTQGWDIVRLLGQNQERFAGEMVGLFLDTKGEIIPLTAEAIDPQNGFYYEMDMIYKEQIIGIIRNLVKQGRLWIIGAGLYKAKGILMALRHGLCNGLVIDPQIADYLIENSR